MNTKNSQFLIKIMKIQLFETCTTYLVQNGIPNSIKIPLFELKFTEVHFFETCTRYLVQTGIQKSTKGSLDPHFWSGAVHHEPGRPARPAWPPVPAGGPGQPAGLAGSPWASWLRSPGAPAGSGFGQRRGGRRPGRQQPRPPTPITAGGLFCM